ncbi:unnamed protein product, partial [marine sediment metagenome]
PDGNQPYEVESFYDEDVKMNNYDATSWMEIKELNANACVMATGGSPLVTTTTTTTTTT